MTLMRILERTFAMIPMKIREIRSCGMESLINLRIQINNNNKTNNRNNNNKVTVNFTNRK